MTPSPTTAVGNIARAREDAANGSTNFISGNKRVDSAAQHIISKALRRSIADAYAAYVAQTNCLPADDYGLALYALEKTYPVASGGGAGRHAMSLKTSPFCSSKAKHAAISNAARKILQNLDQYVHEVATLAPGQLNKLADRQPVFDDKGNRIPWDPAAAARKALWGKGSSPKKGLDTAQATPASPAPQEVPYPPMRTHGGARSRSASPPQQMRRALLGTPHKPPPVAGAGRQPKADSAALHKHEGSHSDDNGVSKQMRELERRMMRHEAEQRRREERERRKREETCAQAARSVVSATAAEVNRERDPILQKQLQNARALLSPPKEKVQEQQHIMALARARLPGFVRLPPHLRVSHYYSHVRPPAPLHDFHVAIMSHPMMERARMQRMQQQQELGELRWQQEQEREQKQQKEQADQAQQQGTQQPSEGVQAMQERQTERTREERKKEEGSSSSGSQPNVPKSEPESAASHEVKEGIAQAALASDLSVSLDAARRLLQAADQQQQQQQQQQPHASEEGGREVPEALQNTGSSISQLLGFEGIDDRQLLDMISLFKAGILSMPVTELPSSDSRAPAPPQDPALAALALADEPGPPPLDGSGIFHARNFNRSRRLKPTNVQLHLMRTTGSLLPHRAPASYTEPSDQDEAKQQQQQQQQQQQYHSTTSIPSHTGVHGEGVGPGVDPQMTTSRSRRLMP